MFAVTGRHPEGARDMGGALRAGFDEEPPGFPEYITGPERRVRSCCGSMISRTGNDDAADIISVIRRCVCAGEAFPKKVMLGAECDSGKFET